MILIISIVESSFIHEYGCKLILLRIITLIHTSDSSEASNISSWFFLWFSLISALLLALFLSLFFLLCPSLLVPSFWSDSLHDHTL